MASQCYTPIDICGAQFNRLDCDGTLLEGDTDVVVACQLVDIRLTPVKQEAQRNVSRNGGGGICAQRTTPARIEGYDVVINVCPQIDPELYELMNLYDLVLDTADITGATLGDSVGIKDGPSANPCNCQVDDCQNPGVSLLVWSSNTNEDGINPTRPYVIMAFPKLRFEVSDIMVGSEYTNYELTAKAEANTLWIDPESLPTTANRGPGDIYPELVGIGTSRWAQWGTDQAPPGGCSCAACGFAELGSGFIGDPGPAIP